MQQLMRQSSFYYSTAAGAPALSGTHRRTAVIGRPFTHPTSKRVAEKHGDITFRIIFKVYYSPANTERSTVSRATITAVVEADVLTARL